MEKVDLIIRGAYVVPIEGEVLVDGAVAVKGPVIKELGLYNDIVMKYDAQEILGSEHHAVLPGMVNTHTHAAMSLFRGYADDLALQDWLEKHIWPAEAKWLSGQFAHDAALLSIIEMLRAGITTYSDMYFFELEQAQAVRQMGIRAVLGAGIVDFPTMVAKTSDEYFENAQRLLESFSPDELISPAIAPHALYTCGPENYKRAVEFSEKHNVLLHTHLSETQWEVNTVTERHKMPPVALLASLDLLTPKTLAAHCVWLTEAEMDSLAANNVKVSHCVRSNMKLASGFARIDAMLNKGITVSLGTDGPASNNTLSVFSEMSETAKIAKAYSNNPEALDARSVLQMATIDGARSLGLDSIIGSLRAAKAADIITVDLEKPHLTPVYNIYSNLVYSAGGADVDNVIVNGRVIIKNGCFTSIDSNEILAVARKWAAKIAS